MTQSDSDNEVVSYVDSLIAYYSNGARKYGKQLWLYKIAALSSSVAVTVLSGIAFVNQTAPWVVTIVAGGATLFNGLLSATKSQEFYLLAATQHARVSSEKLLYLGGGGAYAKEATEEGRLRVLSERTQMIYLEGAKELQEVSQSLDLAHKTQARAK